MIKDYIGLILSGLIIVAVAAALIIARYSPILDPNGDNQIHIVTTILPLYSHTKSIAGDYAAVDNLISPGVSVHEYQFKPSDVKLIADADYIVKNGAGLEDEWLNDLIESSGNTTVVIIDASAGLELISTSEDEGGINGHTWVSPKNAISQLRNIYNKLIKDQNLSAWYREIDENYFQYLSQLERLDSQYSLSLSRDGQNKNIAVFHEAYDYLARDYNFNLAVVVETTPGREPSISELIEISENIGKYNITKIFKEPQFTDKIVELIADENDLDILVLDPLGKNIAADEYLNVMELNLNSLVEGITVK